MAEYREKEFEIIIDRYLEVVNQIPKFTQFDTDSAKLKFKFLEKGTSFTIPYTRLVLVIKKPDKTEVYQEIYTFEGSTAEITLKNQALTANGLLKCQIKMYKESKLESTCQFDVRVDKSIGSDNIVESSNEFQVLQQLFLDVDVKKQEMEQSINDNIIKNNSAVEKNITDNNVATQQNIDAMKSATDAAIKSIDGSSLGQLNEQVLEAKYKTFIASGLMSKVGENKIINKSNLPGTLELTDEDYDQLELLNTPATLEEPMIDEEVDAPSTLEEPMEEEFEDHPTTLEEPMIVDNEVVPIESGFAKSAILKGQTKYRDTETGDILDSFDSTKKLELISVKMPVLTMIGKNLFDGKLEKGSINIDGKLENSSTMQRSVNFIKVKPNTYYTTSNSLNEYNGIRTYDENKTFISNLGVKSTFITPINCEWIKLTTTTTIESVEIQIEEGETKTPYEAYKSNILSTPSDLILRGIDTVKDTLNVNTGELLNKVGEYTLNGAEDWYVDYNGENLKRFICNNLLNFSNFLEKTNYFPSGKWFWGYDETGFYIGDNHKQVVVFKQTDERYNLSLSEFKQWLQTNPITVQYKLATPVVKTVDLSNKPFFFKNGHILLSSGSEDQSLLPTLEYTVPTNLRGQSDNNAESLLTLDNEKVDIKSVDKDATPNSIAQRNTTGDLEVATAVIFKGRGSMGIDPDKGYPVFKDKENAKYDIWNAKNVQIESGSWTPTIVGTTSGKMQVTTRNCHYNRIGKVVFIYGEITVTGAGNAVGNANISNLPFLPNGAMTFTGNIADITNVASPNLTFGILGFGGNPNLRIRQRNITSGSTGSTTVGGLTPTGSDINISFSAFYNHG